MRRTRHILSGLALMAGIALVPVSDARANNITTFLNKLWDHSVRAAEAQGNHEVTDDVDTPARNAIVRVGGCSGALITPTLVLTVGHCVPQEDTLVKRRPHPDCAALPYQARLAGFPWHAPYEWRRFYRGNGKQVRITARRDQAKMSFGTTAVSQPRCADMALLKLARPVPASVATPLPVMTTPPLNVNRAFGAADLRYAGWGISRSLASAHPMRQTGPVRYWGANDCFLATLPPLRRSGERIISGDSGAPLLVRSGDTEIVAGVLWGWGDPDGETCGWFTPKPPGLHGMYTPTFRPQVLGSESTDIGDWLRTMAPEADHR